MKLVEDMDLSGYDRRSVAAVGRLVADSIKHYQDSIPEAEVPNSANGAVDFAVGQVLKLGKGTFNPIVVQAMVVMEGKAWKPGTMLQC